MDCSFDCKVPPTIDNSDVEVESACDLKEVKEEDEEEEGLLIENLKARI